VTESGQPLSGPMGRVRPIGQVRPQQRAVVSGEIRSSTAMALRGCPACRYVLADGTGELDLMFLGRVEVRGMEKGRRCTAEGMAAARDDRTVMWNPRYQLEPAAEEGCYEPDEAVSGQAESDQAVSGHAVPYQAVPTGSGRSASG
jgi:hypothetical protein